MHEASESIVVTLLYLINEPSCRKTIRQYLDIPRLFAIFTEVDQPLDPKGSSDYLTRRQGEKHQQRQALRHAAAIGQARPDHDAEVLAGARLPRQRTDCPALDDPGAAPADQQQDEAGDLRYYRRAARDWLEGHLAQ